MNTEEKLILKVGQVFKEHDLYSDERYKERLRLEIQEIRKQNEWDYFWDLHVKNCKFSENEHNLLTAWLLGLVDDFDINQPPAYIYGEFPDIDVDYIQEVRDYLKNEWAPKTFGQEYVCNIGSYTTFGIKSALIDMARIYGLDRQEILNVTTTLPVKDDDGKPLTWEKALEMSPGLKEYCEKYSDVANAAKKLVNRCRGKGKHAAGLIISSIPLSDFVPLVTDDEGKPVSAWTEGLHSQDLQPVGLIKFDLLSITNLMQIAKIVKLVKENHGLEHICALEECPDWSDISYLNDQKALAMANEGKLKCIFQFDSAGIRELAVSGGVDSFEDLVAYTALYRPGPMQSLMHTAYVERKKGREEYFIHPLLQPILGNTYGVMVYQEEIMQVLHVVGDIPLEECEILRKAISKKKEHIFKKYKEQFVLNGQKNLNWTQEQVEDLFGQIAKWSEYGFNKSHAVGYSFISAKLLYLKSHYPLEFFAGILSCEKDNEKVKEYKIEAERNDIEICPVDINKSGVNFKIVDGKIYMGFSNIKGIGKEVAERIVDNQPYISFEDFLERFGTDASVLKPLIGLRMFKDADPVKLYEFSEYYKKEMNKRAARQKTNLATLDKRMDELRYLLKLGYKEVASHEYFQKYLSITEEDQFALLFVDFFENTKDAWKLFKKYKKSKEDNVKKVAADQPICLVGFVSTGNIINEELKKIYEEDPQAAEIVYYGFGWEHMLEKSPDCEGRTFAQFSDKSKDCNVWVSCVEVQVIEKPKEKKIKKSGQPYYVIRVEDAEWQQQSVTVWQEDYERFKEEFEYWESDSRRGNLLKIRLQRPQPPFPNFTFDSPPKQFRHRDIPAEKEKDFRLMVMKRG